MLVKRGDFAVFTHGEKGDEWVCTNAQIWRSERYNIELICDKTEVFNLVSIPWWARWAIPVNGRSRNPAAAHDPIYASHVGYRAGTVSWDWKTGELDFSKAQKVGISRQMADEMLHEACLEFEVNPIIARLIHCAVAIGGERAYWQAYNTGGSRLPEKYHDLYLTNAPWTNP